MHRIGQVQSSDPTSITRAQTRLVSCRSAELLRLVCARLNCLSGCLCPLATHHSSTGTFKQGPDAGFGGFRPRRQLEEPLRECPRHEGPEEVCRQVQFAWDCFSQPSQGRWVDPRHGHGMAHEAGRWWELCLPQAFQLQQELAGLTTAPAEGEARSPPSLLGGSAGPRRFRRAFPWELCLPHLRSAARG